MSKGSKGGGNSGLVAIVVGCFGFFGVREKLNGDALLAAQMQLKTLRDEITQVERNRSLSEIRAIELGYQIRQKVTEADVIRHYIDSLPFPAWIKKQRDDGQFVMVMINAAYEHKYDIRKARYEGNTDFEVWPHDVAQQYQNNDILVMESRGYHKSVEEVIENGKKLKRVVWKFSLKFNDGTFGVGGIITE